MELAKKFNAVFSQDEILLIKRYLEPTVDQCDDTFVRQHSNMPNVPTFLKKKLSKVVKDSNSQFNLDIFDPVLFESFTYAVYQKSHNSALHNDVSTTHLFSNPTRKLTVAIGLNDADSYQGGDFVFHYTNGIDQLNLSAILPKESYRLSLGDVLVFPSIMYHEITGIVEGVRESLVTLVLGPAYR